MSIYCCCDSAHELCVDTCSRWRHKQKPEHIVLIQKWDKHPKKAVDSMAAALLYAATLNWPEKE